MDRSSEMPAINPEHISKLSTELIELILTTIGNSHAEDPAIQWTQDRHLSAHQLHRLERYFYDHWLPQLCITIYLDQWAAIDYHLQPAQSTNAENSFPPTYVRFKRSRCSDQRPQFARNSDVKASWDRYDTWNPNVHLRLGESTLNNHSASIPMVNDSEITDLCISADAEQLTFNWRKTFTAFFQEELYTRRKRSELVRDGWPLATNYAYFAFRHGRIRDLLWSGMM